MHFWAKKNGKKPDYKKVRKQILAGALALSMIVTCGAFSNVKKAAASAYGSMMVSANGGRFNRNHLLLSNMSSHLNIPNTGVVDSLLDSDGCGCILALLSDSTCVIRKGYTLQSWNTEDDGSGITVPVNADTSVYQNYFAQGYLDFWAQWEENKYTINFNANGGVGEEMGSYKSVPYNMSITLPSNTYTRTGYHFNGWNTKADGSGESYADEESVKGLVDSGTVTLYAQWVSNDYTVKFDGNGATSGTMEDEAMTCGTSKALTANNFKRTGYIFKGWSTNQNAQSASYTDKQNVSNLTTVENGTVQLYAVWEKGNYAVTYNSNITPEKTSTQAVTYDNPWTVKSNLFTREGYTFTGWNTQADGNGTAYTAGVEATWKGTENLTLYAQWSVNEYTVTCIDYCDGAEIGKTTWKANYGTTVSGGHEGTDRIIGKYYSEKRFREATSATVGVDGCTVTREFDDFAESGLNGAELSDDGTVLVKAPVSVTKVTILDKFGIQSIADEAFLDCVNLESVLIGTNSIQTIGVNAFKNCKKLKTIDLPYSVKQIGVDAFAGCLNLKNVYIKNPACVIGDSENTIPGSTIVHGFKGSTAVTYSVKYAKSCENITEIEEGFFLNESTMTEFIIPDDVTVIGDNAFKNCVNLTELQIGNKVESIGNNAFQNDAFKTVIIPATVTCVGKKAFADCTKLEKATFADGSLCQSIREGAFARTALKYGTNAADASENVFYVPENVTTIEKDAFLGCSNIGQITVQNKNAVIEDTTAIPTTTVIGCFDNSTVYNFANSNNYKIAVFAGFEEGNEVGANKYEGNTNIFSAAFGKYVTCVGEAAFKDCTSLTAVYTDVDVVKSIEKEAFSGCTQLKAYGTENDRIALGFKVATIKENAFAGCIAATDLYVENPNCKIFDTEETIENTIRLHSYSKSTTFDYANKYSSVKAFQSTKPSYQVIFNKNGGYDGSDKIYVFTGMQWPDIDAPSRTGYTLHGYYFGNEQCYDADGKFVGNESLKEIADDRIDTTAPIAKWSANKYTIAFDGNGATSGEMQDVPTSYDRSEKLTKNAFARKGYTFAGWNTKADGSGTAINDQETVINLTATDNEVVTLYAQWSVNNYAIVFDGNGADGNMDSLSMAYDVAKTLPTNTFDKGSDYNFIGWNTKTDGSGDAYENEQEVRNLCESGSITLYAQWAPVQNIITYNLAGGSLPEGAINPVLYSFEDTFTLVNPVKDGYEFLGWTGTDLVGYVKDVTVATGNRNNRSYTAHWKLETYTVTYDLAGGNLEEGKTNPASYNITSDSFTLVNPIKRGYTFIGWSTEEDVANLTMEVSIPKGSFGNKKFIANWKVNTYKVNLVLNEGTLSKEDEITSYTYGTEVTLPTPKKSNYVFEGWYDTADFAGNKLEVITADMIDDVTLYAKYSYKEEKSVAIHYYDGEDEITGKADVEGLAVIKDYEKYSVTPSTNVETSFALPETVTKKGYTFVGWYDNASFEGDALTEDVYDGTDENISYFAKFNPVSYEISFENCDDAVIEDAITHYAYGQQTRLPEKIVKDGFAFAGWYDNANCEGESITNVPVNTFGKATFYAKWVAHEFSVTLFTNQGIIADGNVTGYDYGKEVVLPTNISRTGCTFAGWFDNKACEGSTISKIGADSVGDLTFYAKWTPNLYHISYVENNGTIVSGKVETYEYSTETMLPTKMERTGYTFEGWYDNAKLSGEPIAKISVDDYGNKTFYAKWTPNSYKVTLMADGGMLVNAITSYTYGEGAALPTPAKSGFKFEGWYVNSDLTGTAVKAIGNEEYGDKTFYARWSVATVSSNVDKGNTGSSQTGSTYRLTNTISVKKGSTITVGKFAYKITGSGTVTLAGVKTKKITKVVIPASVTFSKKSYRVTAVGNNALKNCKKLKSAVIGKNVKRIGKKAFSNCKKLKKVTIKSKKVSIGAKAFSGIAKKASFKVPASKKKAFKKIIKKAGAKSIKLK